MTRIVKKKLLISASCMQLAAMTVFNQAIADPLLIDGRPARETAQNPSLKGIVREKVYPGRTRVLRAPSLDEDISKNLNQSFSNNDFQLNAAGQAARAPALQERASEPFLLPGIIQNPMQNNKPRQDNKPQTGEAQKADFSQTEPAAVESRIETKSDGRGLNQIPQPHSNANSNSNTTNSTAVEKTTVVRVKHLVNLFEAEVVESALICARNMQKKHRGKVVFFLDLDAVNLIDGQFDFYDTVSTSENGNIRGVSVKHLRNELALFGAEGGIIIASERWVKMRGFRQKTNTMVSGTNLLSDEELAELLLDADNVIDY